MRKQTGITLVSLVITIIVMLILAGVSLSMVMGDSSVLEQAKEAVENTNIGMVKDNISMAWASAKAQLIVDKAKGAINESDYFSKDALNGRLNDGSVMKINYKKTEKSDLIYKLKEDEFYEVLIENNGEIVSVERIEYVEYIEVATLDELQTAISEGKRYFRLLNNITISSNVEISSPDKVEITSVDNTFSMFTVDNTGNLTFKNIVLDGENKWKINVSDHANLSEPSSMEYNKKYENIPLISSTGIVKFGEGCEIKRYYTQPGSDYGSPIIKIDGESAKLIIDSLEVYNCIGQVAFVTGGECIINSINAHDNWFFGNNAGMIVIKNADMTFNNGTIQNNVMRMRDMGMFISMGSSKIVLNNCTIKNNFSTKNGSNTNGALIGTRDGGIIEMNGGVIENNIGFRAGAISTRWNGSDKIYLNAGTIRNNATMLDSFKYASIFSDAASGTITISPNMVIEDKVVVRKGTLINNGTINGDVEKMGGSFVNNGTVTGNIIQ